MKPTAVHAPVEMHEIPLTGSNALYPVTVMPGWLKAISLVNPLTYEANALRVLLLGLAGSLALDFGVLLLAVVLGITAASLLLGRLAR